MQLPKNIRYIGVYAPEVNIFENQYPVCGMTYNSYVIMDEKVVVMDTADACVTDRWMDNLKAALEGRKADYLVVSHMEPDHAANIGRLIELFPDITIVCSAKAQLFISQFYNQQTADKCQVVKEGDTLSTGSMTLKFIMAPMVHWPEVMVTYVPECRLLFSADAFGRFGDNDESSAWTDEARRYYFNICGKYGNPVSTLLKKAAALDIQTICPLHGPVLTEHLEQYVTLYQTWSQYKAETDGLLVAYASIHGNTARIVNTTLQDMLHEAGIEAHYVDLTRTSVSEAIAQAFRYPKVLLAACSYDAGLFPPMEDFLMHLRAKGYCNRVVGLVENGSWAPSAGKTMRALLEQMKDVSIVDPMVTIKSTLSAESEAQLRLLVQALKA